MTLVPLTNQNQSIIYTQVFFAKNERHAIKASLLKEKKD